MPKLFLHVGLPKTATTSIQEFLLRNRDKLIARGVLYPKAGLQMIAHHPLGNIFSHSPADWIQLADPAALASALRDEISETGCDTVIMSTESLAYVPKHAELKEYFRDFDTDIVFYLRRQDEWLESAYQENLKTGRTNLGRDAYMTALLPKLDFHELLIRWSAVFGKEHMRVAVFEKGVGHKSVEHTFLDALGITFQPEYQIAKSSNTGLGRDCLAFFRALSTERRIGRRFWTYGDILREFAVKNPDPVEWRRFWPPAERRALVEHFAESNARVAREFRGREDGTLFHGDLPSEVEPWQQYPGLTTEKAVEIAAFLANSLFDRAEEARKKKQAATRL